MENSYCTLEKLGKQHLNPLMKVYISSDPVMSLEYHVLPDMM